jgi:DDE superfamily endonuclease
MAVLRSTPDYQEKKTAHAAEQDRPDIVKRREAWFEAQTDLDPERLIFIDETSASTKMARLYGRAARGERCRAAVPHGHWKTTTVTAGLRLGGIAAPMVLDGPMNGEAFKAYVDQVLVPELTSGDIVVTATNFVRAGTICRPIRSPAFVRPSKRQAQSCFTCRPTAPTSIPSKWPSPSSKRCCEPLQLEQSRIYGTQSQTPSSGSRRTNVETTSPLPDTMHSDRKML